MVGHMYSSNISKSKYPSKVQPDIFISSHPSNDSFGTPAETSGRTMALGATGSRSPTAVPRAMSEVLLQTTPQRHHGDNTSEINKPDQPLSNAMHIQVRLNTGLMVRCSY